MTAPSSSSAPPPGTERLGTWLRGKYRLDAVLGVGGMAVVYAVTHRNGRRFALKMLHPELSGRSDLRKRFLREGYIANAVGHSGAVAVLDDDIAEDGSAFLVMELLDGEGLDSLIGRYPEGIAVAPALSLAYQVLDVLAAAHAKSVVHRDIKPGNLFATRKGETKVLDFGIARLDEPGGGKATTRTGMTMGTPAFMAPEQAMGRPIDARADLFSVGATLFTVLSGRFVHHGDTGQELMIKAATEPAPSLASLAPHIPSVVTACIDRALAFSITERWQSAEMMQAAIADAFHSLTGGELSGSHLAAIVTHSHVKEILRLGARGHSAGGPHRLAAPTGASAGGDDAAARRRRARRVERCEGPRVGSGRLAGAGLADHGRAGVRDPAAHRLRGHSACGRAAQAGPRGRGRPRAARGARRRRRRPEHQG